jgi:hypothetical protein
VPDFNLFLILLKGFIHPAAVSFNYIRRNKELLNTENKGNKKDRRRHKNGNVRKSSDTEKRDRRDL